MPRQQTDVLHILRNPYGYSKQTIKKAQLKAADLLEEWDRSYQDLLNWAEANGLDVTTRN